jgi:hypothetical protein
MTIGAETPQLPARELFARRAIKDGRLVMSLRGMDIGGEYVVAVDVYPVTGLALEPVPLGPHSFPALDDAVSFVEESLLALEYLGCTIEKGAVESNHRAGGDDR